MELSYEPLDLPTAHEFVIAREGARRRRNVIVRLRDDDGVEGWGEAPATPFYGETADTVMTVMPVLEAALRGAADGDLWAIGRIEAALVGAVGDAGPEVAAGGGFPAHPAARVALSMALHDLLGRRVGAPLWRLWGLDPGAAPPSSFTIGLDEPEAMRQKVREAAGFPILKVKLGTERDEALLALVRDEAPDAVIRVDANTGWSVERGLAMLPVLEEYGVELVEQPLPAGEVEGVRRLREKATMPLIADESCRVAADVPRLAGAYDGVNIKLAKCGSLREALRIVAVARAHDMRVMLGCMVETSIAIAAAVQLAPLVDYVDLDGALLLAEDPFQGPGVKPDGTLRFNGEAGLGAEPA